MLFVLLVPNQFLSAAELNSSSRGLLLLLHAASLLFCKAAGVTPFSLLFVITHVETRRNSRQRLDYCSGKTLRQKKCITDLISATLVALNCWRVFTAFVSYILPFTYDSFISELTFICQVHVKSMCHDFNDVRSLYLSKSVSSSIWPFISILILLHFLCCQSLTYHHPFLSQKKSFQDEESEENETTTTDDVTTTTTSTTTPYNTTTTTSSTTTTTTSTTPFISTSTTAATEPDIVLISCLSAGALVLLIILVSIGVFLYIRGKRRKIHGRYRPAYLETVQAEPMKRPYVIPLPEPERLI